MKIFGKKGLSLVLSPGGPWHRRRPSINDALPPELVEEIFTHLIFNSTWETFRHLTSVCRVWTEIARHLEFVKLELRGTYQVDRLLQRVEDIRLPNDELPRTPTRWLSVSSRLEGYDHYFHRLPEILHYFGSTAHGVYLSYDGGVVVPNEGKACIDDIPMSFPELRSLVITGLARRDTVALLRSCNPKKLKYLGINHHTFAGTPSNSTGLEGLVLPGLRYLSLQTIVPSTDPLRKLLCTAATDLSVLELGINRLQITSTVEFLRAYTSPSLESLKLWIRINRSDKVDSKDPEIQLVRDLLKEKGWRQWIRVYNNLESRMIED